MDNIFAQAFDSAIRRAIELAVEPLHVQIDALNSWVETLKAEIETLKTAPVQAAPTIGLKAEMIAYVDLAIKEALLRIDLSERLDLEGAVDEVLRNTDLIEYIDTDALASDVRDSLDLEEAVRDALKEATVTLNF